MSAFRILEPKEIDLLCSRGCSAADWHGVRVSAGFDPQRLKFVEFIGEVRLGDNCEIVSAMVKDSDIGANVVIRRVGRVLEQCDIAENVIIENVGIIAVEGREVQGIGVEASVVRESGGREVQLHPRLSAQAAYIQAFATSEKFQDKYRELMDSYLFRFRSDKIKISANAVVRDVGEIINSSIGINARIYGATIIRNSTVNGYVGSGSVVRNSIVAENGFVGVSCILEKCFVADSAVLDEGFNAENSLFFANAECLRGEACSAFAGPYTSSHHKSSLLLAGLYSFYTAGSGSNFSNHRFKLGPVHQGVLERGSKTGSASYLIWPSRIAPFTHVIGKHSTVVDTSLFPFSLLLSENNKSILLPGALLFSSGYARDAGKWQERDGRSEKSPDIINSNLFTPFTVDRMIQAIRALKELKKGINPQSLVGVEIPDSYLDKALARYHAGVNYYYGEILAENLERFYHSAEGLITDCTDESCAGEWVDIAGLVTPLDYIRHLLVSVQEGRVQDYSAIAVFFTRLEKNYKKFEWEWVLSRIGHINLADTESRENLRSILVNWLEAAKVRSELVKRDVFKEYAQNMSIGYGLLGDRNEDFTSIHGISGDNPFVKSVQQQTRNITDRAAELMEKLAEE